MRILLIILSAILIISFLHSYRQNRETFGNGTGVCKNSLGHFGRYIDGRCVTNNSGLPDDVLKTNMRIKQLEEKCDNIHETCKGPECEERIKRVTQNIAALRGNNIVTRSGICKLPCGKGFGYVIPEYGNRCLTSEQINDLRMGVKKDENNNEKSNGKRVKKPVIIPSIGRTLPEKSTSCILKGDVGGFEKMCKSKFGNNYGVKNIEQYNCKSGYGIGECSPDYTMLDFVPNGVTDCYPDYTDFDNLCNRVNMKKEDSRSLQYGYESIIKNGCPSDKSRAMCSDRYRGGKIIYPGLTDCVDWRSNFASECKKTYGNNYSVAHTISNGCRQGNMRGVCKISK